MNANVRSIRHLVPLTLLASLLLGIGGYSVLLRGVYIIVGDKVPGNILLNENIVALLKLLMLGVAVSLILYILSSFSEATIKRRQIRWRRFYDDAMNKMRER